MDAVQLGGIIVDEKKQAQAFLEHGMAVLRYSGIVNAVQEKDGRTFKTWGRVAEQLDRLSIALEPHKENNVHEMALKIQQALPKLPGKLEAFKQVKERDIFDVFNDSRAETPLLTAYHAAKILLELDGVDRSGDREICSINGKISKPVNLGEGQRVILRGMIKWIERGFSSNSKAVGDFSTLPDNVRVEFEEFKKHPEKYTPLINRIAHMADMTWNHPPSLQKS